MFHETNFYDYRLEIIFAIDSVAARALAPLVRRRLLNTAADGMLKVNWIMAVQIKDKKILKCFYWGARNFPCHANETLKGNLWCTRIHEDFFIPLG